MLMGRLPGGQAIIDWFGRVPEFHDAELLQIELSSGRGSKMLIHAWNMTDAVTAEGFYVTNQHAVVTIHLTAVSAVSLNAFHQKGIIASLEVLELQSEMQISWTSAFGVQGRIVAGQLSFELEPGRP